MNIQALQYFASIAAGATYLDTAMQYHISLSSLSKAIKRLEGELDIQLFDRSKRTVKLTGAGEALYNHLQRMAPLYNEMMEDIGHFRRQDAITVWTLPYNLMNIRFLLALYGDANPDVRVHTYQNFKFSEIEKYLQPGTVDIIVTHQSFLPEEKFKTHLLREDKLYVVVPQQHPLCNRSAVQFQELADYNIMIREWCAASLQDFFDSMDFTPKLIPCESTRSIIISNLGAERGVALFYQSDIDIYNMESIDLNAIPVENAPANPLMIGTHRSRKRSPETEQLIRFLLKHAH